MSDEELEFLPEVFDEHIDALARCLGIPVEQVANWSDGSLTDRQSNNCQDYYVVDADDEESLKWLDANYKHYKDFESFKIYTNV